MIHTRFVAAMLAGAASVALAGPAFAVDGADLVNKLNAANAVSGVTIGYASIEDNGDTLILKGMTVTPKDLNKADFGDVVLEGVEEDGSGGYTIETVAFPDVNKTKDDVTVVASELRITGVAIPAVANTGSLDSMLMYEGASTGPVSVTVKGTEVFSTTGIDGNITRMAADAGIEFDGTISGLKADLTQVEDPKAKATIEQLGLQQLTGEITMNGSWELASGKFSIDEYAFDFADVGKLNIALAFSGYTPDFVKGVQEAMQASQANPNKEEANAALGMSMMGLMQQLSFESASVTFEDASLTKKLLAFAGAQQGVTGDQMAQSLKGLVPIMMAQLQMPDLQNQVSSAVNTYLDDPKSLTISAEPDNPVPFPMIMGAAMGAPTTIPQVLGVTVSANDEM